MHNQTSGSPSHFNDRTHHLIPESTLMHVANVTRLHTYRGKLLGANVAAAHQDDVSKNYKKFSTFDIQWILETHRPVLRRYGYDMLYDVWLSARQLLDEVRSVWSSARNHLVSQLPVYTLAHLGDVLSGLSPQSVHANVASRRGWTRLKLIAALRGASIASCNRHPSMPHGPSTGTSAPQHSYRISVSASLCKKHFIDKASVQLDPAQGLPHPAPAAQPDTFLGDRQRPFQMPCVGGQKQKCD